MGGKNKGHVIGQGDVAIHFIFVHVDHEVHVNISYGPDVDVLM